MTDYLQTSDLQTHTNHWSICCGTTEQLGEGKAAPLSARTRVIMHGSTRMTYDSQVRVRAT